MRFGYPYQYSDTVARFSFNYSPWWFASEKRVDTRMKNLA